MLRRKLSSMPMSILLYVSWVFPPQEITDEVSTLKHRHQLFREGLADISNDTPKIVFGQICRAARAEVIHIGIRAALFGNEEKLSIRSALQVAGCAEGRRLDVELVGGTAFTVTLFAMTLLAFLFVNFCPVFNHILGVFQRILHGEIVGGGDRGLVIRGRRPARSQYSDTGHNRNRCCLHARFSFE